MENFPLKAEEKERERERERERAVTNLPPAVISVVVCNGTRQEHVCSASLITTVQHNTEDMNLCTVRRHQKKIGTFQESTMTDETFQNMLISGLRPNATLRIFQSTSLL